MPKIQIRFETHIADLFLDYGFISKDWMHRLVYGPTKNMKMGFDAIVRERLVRNSKLERLNKSASTHRHLPWKVPVSCL